MTVTIWYSTDEFAQFIAANTTLGTLNPAFKKLYESDASNSRNFHALPDHIKKILYLDSPDLIVEIDAEPIFSIEESKEAGTGHNAFQRFARLAASVENDVPAFYIYPEASIVERNAGASVRWDALNPLIFHAMEQVMQVHSIPALLYFFPSDYRSHRDNPKGAPNRARKGLKHDVAYPACPDGADAEMTNMFYAINQILALVDHHGVVVARSKLLQDLIIRQRRTYMQAEFAAKAGGKSPDTMSPMTSTRRVQTSELLKHLSDYCKGGYKIGNLLRSREETIIYSVNARYRGDPYPGSLAAIDYIGCRQGKTFEERKYNLVLAWGEYAEHPEKGFLLGGGTATIKDFIREVKASENKNILGRKFSSLQSWEIPRYYMQVRYGSTFSKNKQVRIYAYFADAMLFPDGALWRDG